MNEDKRLKDYVFYSFWATIILWISSIFAISESPDATTIELIFITLWVTVTIFCFVNSIRALCIPKIKKGFIITALVICSILMFLFFIGFIVGIVSVV